MKNDQYELLILQVNCAGYINPTSKRTIVDKFHVEAYDHDHAWEVANAALKAKYGDQYEMHSFGSKAI